MFFTLHKNSPYNVGHERRSNFCFMYGGVFWERWKDFDANLQTVLFVWHKKPNRVHALSLFWFPRSHTLRPTLEDSSERVISCARARARARTHTHTTRARDKHLRPQWDSNPQSQLSRGSRPLPGTARPQKSVYKQKLMFIKHTKSFGG